MSKKIKCLKVSPGMNFDEEYRRLDQSDETWKSVLEEIESCLDAQFLDHGWDGIKLKIELVELTLEQFAELEEP